MNLIILLRDLLMQFIENGFDKVPQIIEGIKPDAHAGQNYLLFIRKALESQGDIFPLERAS